MDDSQIIDLYWKRDSSAIAETDRSYGRYCLQIAKNILTLVWDAEECVNDTWLAAWNQMPPSRPQCLRAFLGRIVRNLSISRWRANRAQKRGCGLDLMLSELEDCIPAAQTVEEIVNHKLLTDAIAQWLSGLDDAHRALFLRRYWYGETVPELAQQWGCHPKQMTQRLLRLRRKLRTHLEAEGVDL